MRRRVTVRAATLLLALLLPVTSVRAAAPSCCVAGDDCELPCCARADQPTVVPVLPCCRTVALDQATGDPQATTLEPAAPALAVLTPTHTVDSVVVLTRHRAAPPAHPLRAPPLYQQHCALLL